MLLRAPESCAVIYTPISPEGEVTGNDRALRFVSLEIRVNQIMKNLHNAMTVEQNSQPLMM